MTAGQTITVRPAGAADRDFIVSLSPRMAASAAVAWRDPADLDRFQLSFIQHSLDVPGSAGFVAEDAAGTRLGFVHVEPAHDPVHGRWIGYVSLLAVTDAASGQGVGRALVVAAENWSRRQGHASLQLDVFAGNDGGRAFYDRLGFAAETLRLIKPLA